MTGYIAGSVREADRMQELYALYFGVQVYVPVREPITPSAQPTPVQQSLPTSTYGQTIPVLWGCGRVPGAYIWAVPLPVPLAGQISVTLTSRLRFARPLVANSSWRLRKIWAAGTLILDRTVSFRSPLITYLAEYDGQDTQDRDALMVETEGETAVSAHRGYLDIVMKLDIGVTSAPPVIEAEWVQDATDGYVEDGFTEVSSDFVNELMPNWDGSFFRAISEGGNLLRKYHLSSLHEVAPQYSWVAPAQSGYLHFRYVSKFGSIVHMAKYISLEWFGRLIAIDGTDIDQTSAAVTVTDVPLGAVLLDIGLFSFYVGYTDSARLFVLLITATSISETVNEDAWNSYSSIQCITIGAIRATSADIYVCADNDLVKVVINQTGAIVSSTVVKTFSDALRYCVYDAGFFVVWTDSADVIRINSSGTVIYTKTVPYQIESAGTGASGTRNIGDPDLQNLTKELLFQTTTACYLTNLKTGVTTTATRSAVASVQTFFYNDVTGKVLTTTSADRPVVGSFTLSDPVERNLEDFLADLTEAGGFDSSEHDEVGINDTILGAIVDSTIGMREVARSTTEPYSIAIFERSAQIIYKRAATDGAFVVDFTLSTSDFTDRNGQSIGATRRNAEEFIARYGINYRDPDEVYQSRPQFGEIPSLPFPVAPTDNAVKADIPIIAGATKMKTVATKRVQRMAIEEHEYGFTLRAKYGDVEPEDIINFSYAGRSVTARVEGNTLNPDFTNQINCTEFLTAVDITVTGATGRPITAEPSGDPDSSYYHLDIPLLEDADDLGGAGLVQYHVLASQGQDNWEGAVLYRNDSGYVPVSAQTEDGLVGIATTLLPDWDIPYVTEFTREITVQIVSGDTSLLASATYAEVLEGANKFAIGAPGRWEVCHVIDVTDNLDGTFTFTGLRRGRGVSEEHTASHAVGDYVVWLSGDNVQNLGYSIADLDQSFSFKPVGFGGNLTLTTAQSETVTGEAEKIPKPAQLDASISAGDVILDWVRRTRIGSFWSDLGEDVYTAPLGETLEEYVIRIKDGPGGTIKRTVTVDDVTTYTYSAANQTTDFGGTFSAGDEFTFDIRQVSGTGVICPTREETITLS